MVALALIRGISPRSQYQSLNQGTGENGRSNGHHSRSATLFSGGFSSALVAAKAIAASSCLVPLICDAHQVEHQQL